MSWKFDGNGYSPALGLLLPEKPRYGLDGATALKTARQTLSEQTRGLTTAQAAENLLAPQPMVHQEMAELCLAGLWLLVEELDQSHAICQRFESPTGSFWHGIMHRREGDAGNSKYWLRRTSGHPAIPLIQTAIVDATGFDYRSPSALTDLYDRANSLYDRANSHETGLCQHAQALEWQVLFDWCFRQATGQSD